ncbi:MAG TPA: efflux RND transporter periplasmic adaptor subunit [Sandaracinaceae bacterium]
MRTPALALIGVLALGCGSRASPPEEPAARLVVTDRVTIDDAVDAVEILGDVRGREEVRVFSQVPERIRILHVQEGATVRAGDPIATLEADLQSSSLSQADAALAAAEASREQLRAELARISRLVGEGAMPRSQLETLEAQLRTSDAQVAQLRAARRTAGEQRARTVVRAPIDGTVALLSVSQGDMAVATVPICTIVQTDRVVVELRVTEQDYVRIREGMPVTIRPPALPEVVRTGTVVRVSPVLDPLTRTALVEVDVENADGTLRPGMVANATIELSRRSDVVLAPARALVLGSRTSTEREAAVFVLDRERGVARRAVVRLGRRYDRRVEILEGLRGGEEVIVQGQHLLRDGARVRTASEPPPLAEAR